VTEALVSVVTPVHNTAAYLAECMESVLAQTHRNFEYVVLDNCSTDSSLDIAKRYAAQDSRIRIEQTPRLLGQVANYNRALELVDGSSRYCKIVQADDWLYPDCLADMVAAAEKDPEVALVGAYQIAGDRIRGQGLVVRRPDALATILTGSEACRAYLLHNKYLFGSPTSVLYRADLVRERRPFYPDSSYHEDSEVCFEILKTRKFAFVHKVLTYTRVDNVSLSTVVQDYAPDALHAMIILHKFGSHYLSRNEYAARLREVTDEIYSVLSHRLLEKDDARLWDYHRRGFEMAGQTLSFRRLWSMKLARGFWLLGNPLLALRKIVARLAR
jgi:glycosyltransferase involved in cell wall biosynthesis